LIKKITVGSSHSGGAGIGKFLLENPHVKYLELEWEALRDPLSICEALQSQYSELSVLNLTHNELGPDGAIMLSKALEVNCNLKELDLRENNIGSYAFEKLAESLCFHPSIETLHVEDNELGDAGANSASNLLRMSRSIKYMFLDGNIITDIGGNALLSGIADSPLLSTLGMVRNQLSNTCKELLLATWMARNTAESLTRRAKMLTVENDIFPSKTLFRRVLSRNRQSLGGIYKLFSASTSNLESKSSAPNGSLQNTRHMRTMSALTAPNSSKLNEKGVVVSPLRNVRKKMHHTSASDLTDSLRVELKLKFKQRTLLSPLFKNSPTTRSCTNDSLIYE